MDNLLKQLDLVSKAIAVLGAYALLLGFTYNTIFFSGPQSHWLPLLSLSDHVATTISMAIALGFVCFAMIGTGDSLQLGLDAEQGSTSFGSTIRAAAPIIKRIGLVGISISALSILGGGESRVGLLILITLVLALGFLVFQRSVLPRIDSAHRVPTIVGLIAISGMGCVAAIAAFERALVNEGRGYSVSVRTARDNIEGRVVRVLDAGILLIPRDHREWVLVPKSEIREVRDVQK